MASEQVRRDNITNLREIHAEHEDIAPPKAADRRLGTSAEKIHGGSVAADLHGHPGAISVTGTTITSTHQPGEGQHGREREGKGEEERQGKEWPSLEEAARRHRATAAQQNTTETLRAAEERYEKAKQRERQALDEAAEKARKAAEISSDYAARKKAEEEEAEREKAAKKATEKERNEEGGGVLGAIGETIVEIGQTAQDLVAGRRTGTENTSK